MNKQKTIIRLVEIKRRTADASEAKHVAAHAMARAAEQSWMHAHQEWLAAIDAKTAIGNAADLEDRDVQIQGLRRRVEESERRFCVARLAETQAREEMTDARVELRRFETWLEREQATEAIEVRRLERRGEDDLALRKRSVG